MGDVKASNALYEKSADLPDVLLSKVPTPMIERELLSDLGIVYAGYFSLLSDQGRMADAFRAIERALGRVETQALSHHEIVAPHQPTVARLQLTSLNLQLLNKRERTAFAAAMNGSVNTHLGVLRLSISPTESYQFQSEMKLSPGRRHIPA
jgi:hypothetical protein